MTATLFRQLDEQGYKFSMITTRISSHEHCLLEEKGVMWLPIQIITYSLNKLKYLLQPKELEVISRYFEVIPVSLHQITNSNWKLTDFACPILCQKKQLWDIPEHCKSFTLCLQSSNKVHDTCISPKSHYLTSGYLFWTPDNLKTLEASSYWQLTVWWVLIIIYFLFNTTSPLPVYAPSQFLNLYRPKKPNVASTLVYWGTFSLYNLLCSNHVLFS